MDEKSELPSSADFARIEGALFDRIALKYRRQVVRHRLVAVAAVLVVAGAGIAGGTVANPTKQSTFANCYDGSSTGSRVAQVALPTNGARVTQPGATASAAQVANALALCTGFWRDGGFRRGSSSGPVPVPKLQVCLRDDLVISVFRKPAGQESAGAFCNDLGLSAP